MTPDGPRVLLLLSGGGAKAAAHVGALRALAELGLEPAHLVGTSMGGVMGACYAAGMSPDAILARIGEVGAMGIVRAPLAPWAGLRLRSLLQGAPLRRAIEALVPARSFDQLTLPLAVTAVDLDSGALVTFGAGGRAMPLVDALWASCALPVYYPPVTLGGRRYADGGLRGVVPFAAAEGIAADVAVAVDIGPGFDEADSGGARPRPPLIAQHDAATGILMAQVTRCELALWRATPGRPPLVYVRPCVEREATFRVERAAAYAEEGYRATAAALAGCDALRARRS
ncbi:MAG TPA: patatin-like phospholipase family protein [Gemmatimonadales bacterium]|nr:patatin-like phospholipase family protein [Gemmatimonadales bacterium]